MSLLLTFFILLFSMSSLEVDKFRQAAQSLHEGFGESDIDVSLDYPNQPPLFEGAPQPTGDDAIDPVEHLLDEIAAKLSQFIIEYELTEQVTVIRDDLGVLLRMESSALFRPGSANVEVASESVVLQLALITRSIDAPVIVSGHTDNVPMRTSQFQSNWELSAARAAGVARRLVLMGQDAADVRVEAFGKHRPVDTNDSSEGRSRNRRVELFYSKQAVEESLLQSASG